VLGLEKENLQKELAATVMQYEGSIQMMREEIRNLKGKLEPTIGSCTPCATVSDEEVTVEVEKA
jgi:hypothetical protein